ncbi:hypothetical protein GPA27_28725 [Aromatoleum toluolicum]|uniref:Transposase n=1 Tax=Aromatoleum toluolicum TaxID=90060 RepID=A0ABX1NPX2_9RHOO|nr:hypothetical protein [Aromatoleum toluolicum]NMG01352.1 hypothetical protein [Aromatoleum toluolicum]
MASIKRGQGHWSDGEGGVALTRAQFDALVLGLPWRQLGEDGVIRIL